MDNGEDVLLLFRAEVVYFARDLAIDVAGVDHQYFVAVCFGFGAVEKPQFAGDGAGVEKVGANGDHGFYIAGFYQFSADFGFIAASTRCLGGHDKACAARFVQVAVEVADPDVVAAADFVLFVHAG